MGIQKNCLNQNPKQMLKLARKKIQYNAQKCLTGPILLFVCNRMFSDPSFVRYPIEILVHVHCAKNYYSLFLNQNFFVGT